MSLTNSSIISNLLYFAVLSLLAGAPNLHCPVPRPTHKSAINADGTLGGWQETTSLPEPVYRSGVIRIGSKLLSIGGLNGSFLDKTYYADINADATLGPWSLSSNHLPQPVCCAAVSSSGNYLYLTGGFNGNYLNTVYMTQIGVATGEDKFDLPFSYVGRPTNDQGIFRSAFWQRLTAAFDHTFKGGMHRPFTGDTYGLRDCLRGIVGISCYDSHNGTDFDDVPDNPVYSVGSGEVIYTSEHDENSCRPNAGGFGCVVIVEYPSQGVFGLYAHLGKINVNAGDEVNVNDELGKMGATGCPGCGSHLHFGVMKSLNASPSSVAKSMTKVDWHALLFTIRPSQIGGFRAFCSYRAPNGQRFSFQDPSGWKGENPDPWTLERPDGCEVESPYLWKFDVGN
jgi:murein DD-endopeptidase MepM/ murein hydrolase activator NlpD